MNIGSWKYYNNAYISTKPPHEEIKESQTDFNMLFQKKEALFIRWTSDFDCGYETNWWYVIKENSFDLDTVKAKRRYEINKGNKNFDCVKIDPRKYTEKIYCITISAYSAYPKKYRPRVKKDSFIKSYLLCCDSFYATFDKTSGKMTGYAIVGSNNNCLNLKTLKTDPSKEKYGVNAALVYGILSDLKYKLDNGFYICDGERNILHKSNFQDYLIKYFHFRKAYCKLNIKYRPLMTLLVKLLYPFKKIFALFKEVNICNQIGAVLKMEEIVRGQK